MLVACQGLQNLEPFLTPTADPPVQPTVELDQTDALKAPSKNVPDPNIAIRGSKGGADQTRVTPTPSGKIGAQPKPLPTANIKPVPPAGATSPKRKAGVVLATAIPRPGTKPVPATTTPKRESAPAVATATPPSEPKRRIVSSPTPTRTVPTPNVQKEIQEIAEAVSVAATLVSLNISADSSSVNVNNTLQFTALGTYSDDAVEDVTARVSWNSTDQVVGIIGSTGQFTALAAGNTTIQASQDDVDSNALSLTVSPLDTASGATHLAFLVQPSSTVAGATITPAIQVEILDSDNNRVTDATTSITLVISRNTSSTLSGTTTVAAVDGVATFSDLSIDNVAIGYLLDATADGLTDATSDNFEIDEPVVATHLAFLVQPSSTVAGAIITPAIQVEILDSNNNRVTDTTTSITLIISRNTSSTLSGTTTVAAIDGVATFSDLSIDNVAIGYLLDASGDGLTDATSANFEIDEPAVATHLAFLVQPSSTVAGAIITPAIQVEILDSNNNRVTDATTSITLVISRNTSSTMSGTTSVAAIDGIATFSDLSIDTVAIGYLLAATGDGLTDATSANFEIIT